MSQALYRRYRPETFAEVIGQEHVTEPLAQALRANRVNHAYLFSGPRGCGKTTSARILARCLNCAEGPTPNPCGTCESCVELGRGGPGSLDVVEIDAASHNGVDDARDLRERVAFAPARDRYKIFILDEAHMVTSQGFNALLKTVEEPPEHVKFVFATTEPDKVIGTIRSRTHHYPFRLVAPETLTSYLEEVCGSEHASVGPGVLPLVVRAGGGSVRDSLSVLDQLLAGAADSGLDYERAVSLLGYTDAALLDDVVEAIAARDGASVFRVIARVISSGHEPRRFVEDLLERLRDLIVLAASGESAGAVLREVPADQFQRMQAQAVGLGPAELSRSADLVNAALSEMTGATSPRLHLELLAARLLLPGRDDASVVARLERMERAVDGGSVSGSAVRAVSASAAPRSAPAPVAPVAPVAQAEVAQAEVARAEAAPSRPAPTAEPSAKVDEASKPEPTSDPVNSDESVGSELQATAGPSSGSAAPEAEMVRRRWPEVLEMIKAQSRVTWSLVSANASVGTIEGGVLTLAFTTPQLANNFRTRSQHGEVVAAAVREILGVVVRVEPEPPGATKASSPAGPAAPAVSRPAAGTGSRARAQASWDAPASPPPSTPSVSMSATDAPPASTPPVDAPKSETTQRGASAAASRSAADRPRASAPASDGIPDGPEPQDDPGPISSSEAVPARRGRTSSPRAASAFSAAAAAPGRAPGPAPADGSDASPDDPELAGSGLVGAPLVAQMLGGTVIDEIPDEAQ